MIDYDIIKHKTELRAQLKAALKQLLPRDKAAQESAICARVCGLPQWIGAAAVMIYLSMPDEFDTARLLSQAYADGKTVCVPRIHDGGMTLVYLPADSRLERGALGIRQPPDGAEIIAPGDVDAIIVPGLGFDTGGRRLGRGGGYFDRLLAGYGGATIAPCLSCSLCQHMPAQPHDRPVDIVVTADETYGRALDK